MNRIWVGCKKGDILSAGIEPEAIVKRVWMAYSEDLARVKERLRLEGKRTLEMFENIWFTCLIE